MIFAFKVTRIEKLRRKSRQLTRQSTVLSIGGTYCDKLGSLRVLGVFQIILGSLCILVHTLMLTQYHNLSVDVNLVNTTQVHPVIISFPCMFRFRKLPY